jgi:hypothetical protein
MLGNLDKAKKSMSFKWILRVAQLINWKVCKTVGEIQHIDLLI